MSVRLLTNRLFKQSRYLLQCYYKRDIYTNILEHGKNRGIPSNIQKSGGQNTYKQSLALRSSGGLFRFGQHARKIFIDNILNRVTTNYSAELRSQATKKLFYGDSAPFFALVGVSLASGAGVLTKEDELEGVCWEIREAASKLQKRWNTEEISETIDDNFSIDNLDIGPHLANGCAAVVYAASFKNEKSDPIQTEVPSRKESIQSNYRSEMLSPIQNMSRFVHNFGGSVDNLFMYNHGLATSSSIKSNLDMLASESNEATTSGEQIQRSRTNSNTSQYEFIGSNMSLNSLTSELGDPPASVSILRYPLALKMMFNYDIQSNAMSILRAMYKETIPARRRLNNENADGWEKLLRDQTLSLPPHPNIVLMFGYFCAEVRDLVGGQRLYPMALPPRINRDGYGRNMSLYLLMKRYDCSLRSYLESDNINIRTRILLFTQLLEAIAHLSRHGVAHRDLKSDNILIELSDDNNCPPVLVLSDFGCCLADKIHGLQVPYSSYDIDKGGNTALMAPEIINKAPGTFSILNYSKSDLWATGAIAYEIFGLQNPFYPNGEQNEDTKLLKNVDYKHSDLPELTSEMPVVIRELILNILHPNPSKRVSPDTAANIMQLFLWAPSSWLKSGGMPSSTAVLQWLLCLTTKVMCEGKNGSFNVNTLSYKMGRRTYTEYLLICSFLARAKLRRLRGALSWIQSVV